MPLSTWETAPGHTFVLHRELKCDLTRELDPAMAADTSTALRGRGIGPRPSNCDGSPVRADFDAGIGVFVGFEPERDHGVCTDSFCFDLQTLQSFLSRVVQQLGDALEFASPHRFDDRSEAGPDVA